MIIQKDSVQNSAKDLERNTSHVPAPYLAQNKVNESKTSTCNRPVQIPRSFGAHSILHNVLFQSRLFLYFPSWTAIFSDTMRP